MVRMPMLGRVAAALLVMLTGEANASPAVEKGGVARTPKPHLEARACPELLAAAFHCGTLVVPERWGRPGNRTVRLPYAVHRADSGRATPNALTFLDGGPGFSAMRDAPIVLPQISELGEDFVVLDRRGLGLSDPAFQCEPGTRTRAGYWNLQLAKACHDRWAGAGHDLSAYDTAAAAADLESLRKLLGYRQWDILGVSYGTAYGIAVIRDFPRSVRSALLDSIYPFGIDPFRDSLAKRFAALDRFFAVCAKQSACGTRYGDLKAKLIAAVRGADRQPGTVNGERVDGSELLDRVLHAAQTTELLPRIPAMIDAASRGDMATFAEMTKARDINSFPAPGFPKAPYTAGMWPVVECRERFSRHHGAQLPVRGWPEDVTGRAHVEHGAGEVALCRMWRAKAAPASIDRKIDASVPTLIMIGDHDPQTDRGYARAALAKLPRTTTRFAVIPNSSHVASATECGGTITRRFFRDPTGPLADGCIAKSPPLDFLILPTP